jgi:hypothetical protein
MNSVKGEVLDLDHKNQEMKLRVIELRGLIKNMADDREELKY